MGAIHLRHMHEDLKLTFGEIKGLLNSVAAGDIEAIEKFDGQSVFFTWDAASGDIKTAYSEPEIRTGGLTPDEWLSRWSGHPAEGAFVNGMRAIQRGVNSLDSKALQAIFGTEGRNFIMSEILYPDNPNMINYDASYIVMHNLRKYDETGKEIDAQLSGGEFSQLVTAVESAQKEVDSEGWKVVGPQITNLRDLTSGGLGKKYTSMLDSVANMSDDATIADYVEERLRTDVVGNLGIPVVKQEGLIKLILGKEGAPSLKELKSGLDKDTQKKVSSVATKQNMRKTIVSLTRPIERVISDFAVEALDGLSSVFVADHDAEVSRLRDMLVQAKSKIEGSSGDEGALKVLAAQMDKLGNSVENVSSSLEGIVFEYPPGSKSLYKLTGGFAMLNQIVGRARRMKSVQSEALLREYLRMQIMPILAG